VLGHANIQDLLILGVKTDPPIMTGTITMHTKLSLFPSDADVANRLKLAGNFRIPAAHFTNDKVQDRVDSLSLRSRGEPKLAAQKNPEDVTSNLQGRFTLQKGLLDFSSIQFVIPGTRANMDGQYSLDGKTFDFHGTLKLDAKLSQMTTGFKSLLLKAVDPFFHKDGAGAEIPFKVTGTRDEPHFGLDFHHKDEPPPSPRGEADAKH
jgi:hypothetical protein